MTHVPILSNEIPEWWAGAGDCRGGDLNFVGWEGFLQLKRSEYFPNWKLCLFQFKKLDWKVPNSILCFFGRYGSHIQDCQEFARRISVFLAWVFSKLLNFQDPIVSGKTYFGNDAGIILDFVSILVFPTVLKWLFFGSHGHVHHVRKSWKWGPSGFLESETEQLLVQNEAE